MDLANGFAGFTLAVVSISSLTAVLAGVIRGGKQESTMKNLSSLAFAIALTFGCGNKTSDVNVRSLPRLPSPVINVPQAAPPAVNVAAPNVTVTPNVTAAVTMPTGTFVCPSPTTPGDCDGDTVLDSADQCFNVQQGQNADPARPGCPLTIVTDASSDASDATADASADAVDASADVATDAGTDGGSDAAADTTPDAPAMQPTPTPPPVTVNTTPVVELPGNTVGTAIQARVNLAAARTFCSITAEQVRSGQRAAHDAPCTAGEIGCWRRASSERVKTCSESHDAPGCVTSSGTAYGCSGDAARPNAWVYRCGPRVTGDCNPENLAAAAGIQPTR